MSTIQILSDKQRHIFTGGNKSDIKKYLLFISGLFLRHTNKRNVTHFK